MHIGMQVVTHSNLMMAGTLTLYINILFSVFWLFHTITIFWIVWFPIHSRQFEQRGHNKYLHTAVVLVALLFPIIPVGAAFGSGGFVIASFPPVLSGGCFNRDGIVLFYTFIFLFCIIFPTGVTIILLTFWKLHGMKMHVLRQVHDF